MIIIRPGLGVFDLGALLALAGGTTFAFYLLATRRLSGTSPALVTLAFTALLGALLGYSFGLSPAAGAGGEQGIHGEGGSHPDQQAQDGGDRVARSSP